MENNGIELTGLNVDEIMQRGEGVEISDVNTKVLLPKFVGHKIAISVLYSTVGRTSVSVTCPVCNAKTTAFLWSLSGSGKLCTCGALLTPAGAWVKPVHPQYGSI